VTILYHKKLQRLHKTDGNKIYLVLETRNLSWPNWP